MRLALLLALLCLLAPASAHAGIFSHVRGIVHDPQHRPVAGARVELHADHSAYTLSLVTAPDGTFAFPAIPLGDYHLTVSTPGFAPDTEALALSSETSSILHLQLHLATVQESLSVSPEPIVAIATPTTTLDRADIAQTPGADRSNSLAMITDYVPGAYITHDMLHMRGGHQVSWQIDGVEIPNTNIASNLGPQIDPKDIDYLEADRGSYPASLGDRTYGIFNIVPRTGFERTRQAELVVTAGSFAQTNDQLSLGDHTARFAWYASLNANRSAYGLSTPVPQVVHDLADGYGGFASLILNATATDQLRLVTQLRTDFYQIPYDPSQTDFESQQFDSSGLRDAQHETDGLAAFTWLHTFPHDVVLAVSPFYHYNSADYRPSLNDQPVASTVDRASNYGGLQTSVNATLARHTLEAGLYSFSQHDGELFAAAFNCNQTPTGCADANPTDFTLTQSLSGGVIEQYVSDTWKPTGWLTVLPGLRATQFRGAFAENVVDPRIGLAARVPKINWTFRAFYGRFYQPPPLLTASGPLLSYAESNNTAFAPLHGERDEEHQFGVQIPLAGWLLDADTFKTRADNFLDHSNIGESSIYFPVTIDGALIRGWELTLRSPRWRFGQAHLAYSNQIAEQRGALTGGLICSPTCTVSPGYTPLDHDQRNTLTAGFNARLPHGLTASTNVAYGSGFTNGAPDPTTPYPNPYLPAHTSVDLSVGKQLRESTTLSLTALNITNQRVLLDNSLTFGGFHFSDPRQLYAELRYRFHF